MHVQMFFMFAICLQVWWLGIPPLFSQCVVVVPRCFLSVLCCSMSTSLVAVPVAVPVFGEGEEESEENPDRRNNMRTRSERRVWVSHPSPHRVGSLAPSIRTRAQSSGPVPSSVARGQVHSPGAFFPARASSHPPVRDRVRIVSPTVSAVDNVESGNGMSEGVLEWQWMLQQ